MLRSTLPPKSLSAGMIVVRDDGRRYRLLCLRTFESWDFPKCEVPGDEPPLAVAERSVREATGIENLALHWGEEYRETVPYEDGRVSRYYMAETAEEEVALRLPADADAEDDYEYRWVTVDEAEDLLPPRLALVLDWAVRALATAPTQGKNP